MKTKNIINECNLMTYQTVPVYITVVGYVFLTAYLIYRCFYRASFSDYIAINNVFGEIRQYSYFHFSVIGILTLLFLSLEKDQILEEIILKHTKKQRRIRIGILLCFNLIYTLFICGFIIVFCFFEVNPGVPRYYYKVLLIQIFYDYFGVGVFAIFLNNDLSYIKSKVGRITTYVITQFVFGYPFVVFSDLFKVEISNNKIINCLTDFLTVLPDGFQYGLVDSYSVAFIQPHHIALLFSWMCILLIISYFIEKKNKAIVIIICLLGVAIVVYLMPWTANYPGYRRSDNLSSIYQTPIYCDEKDFNIAYEMEERVSNNKITDYSIRLDAFLFPVFDVEMTFENPVESGTIMTLQKGYRIISIKDEEGKDIEYKRYNHYLEIYPQTEINAVKVKYYGEKGSFNGDVSSIFMKPGIPFFPMLGARNVYKKSDFYNMKYWELNRVDRDTHFWVKINTFGRVISSLPEKSYNEFEGYSDSFFILKGMYDEKDLEGVRIIYPYAAEDVLSVSDEKEVKKYLEWYWEEIDPQRTTQTILLGYINGINTREIEKYEDFACINTFYYFDDRKETIKKYILIEGQQW